jgi:hypothetical protein
MEAGVFLAEGLHLRLTAEQVQSAARIAAVVHAVAATLEAERAETPQLAM